MKKLLAALSTALVLASNIIAAVPAHAVSENLIANPSMETSANSMPTDWNEGNWGKNTTSFSYLATGHTGSHSGKITMRKHTNGDAKWYFNPVAVTPNTSYTFSDWYKSSVATSVDVVITATNGTESYLWQGNPAKSATWKQANYTFTTPANAAKVTVYHSIEKVGNLTTDDARLVDNAVVTPVTPPVTPTAPTVSVTAPLSGAAISGTTTVTANAVDATAVSSVQFKLDGANLGAPVTASPYTTSWDTTTAANGSHILTAVATNTSNLTTTSTSVTVTVNNVVTPPVTPVTPSNGPNLIPNPSVETASGTAPASWLSSNWGANTSAFSYLNTGHTGSRSVEVQTTKYTSGAANWYYADVPVTAGTTYQYTNWYKSNVDTEVDAEITMSDGTVQYAWLGNVLANTNWTKYTATYTVPAGAKSMAVYQILAKVGYIISDDYSLNTYTPVPFNRGIVSVSFDDGWQNQYLNAMPILKQDNIPGTYNIISGSLDDTPDYMTSSQVKALYAAGNEIASHTVTHPDLTTVSATKLTTEMKQSQTTLQNLLGTSVTDFAYPYGAYNTATLTEGAKYYQSQRSVNAGLNTKDNLNLQQLKIYEVDSNISVAQVKGWIDAAIAQKSWLILVFHEVAVTPSDPTDALYDTQPTDIAAEMAYLHSTGVATETVHQAIGEVVPQL